MGQILPGSARATASVRRAMQHSQESLIVLSKRHGINPGQRKRIGKAPK
jgi:ribosome maturation protein Sdo1